jgi:hypothetical protein
MVLLPSTPGSQERIILVGENLQKGGFGQPKVNVSILIAGGQRSSLPPNPQPWRGEGFQGGRGIKQRHSLLVG